MLQCPACQAEMQPDAEQNVRVYRCPRCSRVWLERCCLPELLRCVPRRFLPDDLVELRQECARRKQSAVAEAELFGSVDYFNCPQCSRPMQRKSFARVSYIVVQVCQEHGLLATAEGLAQLRDFLARGGELLVWERLYNDLVEKIRRMARPARRRRPSADVFPDHPLNQEISILLALNETLADDSQAGPPAAGPAL